MGFERVFIIGFGQMGRSIANTLRVNHFSGKIFASSRSKIENCDYFDEEFDYNNANYNNSIVFICTPPNIINEMVGKIVEITKKNKNCIIADVCSVKKNDVKINETVILINALSVELSPTLLRFNIEVSLTLAFN